MRDGYVIGADVGTTGAKAMLLDGAGRVLRRAYRGYPLTRQAGRITQEPEDWYRALGETVREAAAEVAPDAVRALALSTQGGALVWSDGAGRPLCPASSWMDGGGAALPGDPEAFRAFTGWEPSGWCAPAKLRAWGDRGAAKLLSTADWLAYRLTGRFAIDPSNAAMLCLLDVRKRDWDDGLLSLAGIRREQLPELVPTGVPVGALTPDAARALGLTTGTVLLSGGHDQYCAAYGAGLEHRGELLLSCGTAWVALAMADAPPRTGAWGAHLTPGLWGALTSISSAGASMEWVCRLAGCTLQEADAGAAALTDAPVFLPGFGAPTGGCFAGLELDHGPFHLIRGVMEGVAFETRRAAEGIGAAGRVVVNGGASRSRVWMGILADALERELWVPEERDLACLGAGRVAGGWDAAPPAGHAVIPMGDLRERYRRYLEARHG